MLGESYDLLQTKAPAECVSILIGNKADLTDRRQVRCDDAEDYRLQTGAAYYFETLALTESGIRDLFETAAADSGLAFEREDGGRGPGKGGWLGGEEEAGKKGIVLLTVHWLNLGVCHFT
jgi:hypothetical protein